MAKHANSGMIDKIIDSVEVQRKITDAVDVVVTDSLVKQRKMLLDEIGEAEKRVLSRMVAVLQERFEAAVSQLVDLVAKEVDQMNTKLGSAVTMKGFDESLARINTAFQSLVSKIAKADARIEALEKGQAKAPELPFVAAPPPPAPPAPPDWRKGEWWKLPTVFDGYDPSDPVVLKYVKKKGKAWAPFQTRLETGISTSKLESIRKEGKGPLFYHAGKNGRHKYIPESVREWMKTDEFWETLSKCRGDRADELKRRRQQEKLAEVKK